MDGLSLTLRPVLAFPSFCYHDEQSAKTFAFAAQCAPATSAHSGSLNKVTIPTNSLSHPTIHLGFPSRPILRTTRVHNNRRVRVCASEYDCRPPLRDFRPVPPGRVLPIKMLVRPEVCGRCPRRQDLSPWERHQLSHPRHPATCNSWKTGPQRVPYFPLGKKHCPPRPLRPPLTCEAGELAECAIR